MGEHQERVSLTEHYRLDELELEAYEFPSEQIISGHPSCETAVIVAGADGSSTVGLARISVGTVRAEQPVDEFALVTKGRVILTSDHDQESLDCSAGSFIRLTKGLVYTKEIVEAYEEIYFV